MDLNLREYHILLPLTILIFFMGIFPFNFLQILNVSINNYLYL